VNGKPYEKAEKCVEQFESLLGVLDSSNVNVEIALEQLRKFVMDFPEAESEKQVTEAIKAFLSLKLEKGAAVYLRVLEVAFQYFIPLQKLSKLEELFYKARTQCGVQGTHKMFEELLILSGRHKLRPSIELAFKSWKKDFGLLYEYIPSSAPLDATPRLRIFGLKPSFDDSEPPSLVAHVKDAEHRQHIVDLFCLTIKAASKAKEIELAVQIFEEALLVLKYDDSLFETMVDALCHANRIENAHRLLYDMHEAQKVTFRAIHSVLRACGRLQNYFLAERLFLDISTSFHLTPTVETWNELLEVHVLRGAMEVAHERFVQMLNTKERTRPNLATYELLVAGHVRAKDVERVTEMLKHAKSNKVAISPLLYAWVMEAHLHAKQYDEAFDIVNTLRREGGELPQKFQNLLLRKCRRVDGLLPRYEAIFGPAPDPVDDLKEIRIHAEALRRLEQKSKLSAQAATAVGRSTSNSTPSSPDNELKDISEPKSSIEGEREQLNDPNIETVAAPQVSDLTDESQKQNIGVLEEVVEDEAEMSMEEWMKDDMGEHGWKDLSVADKSEISPSGKKKKSKYANMVNLRYRDVFEAAGWNDKTDLDGAVEVRQWQILDDPFSRPRPEVLARRQVLERSSAQIEALQAEVIEKIDAQTTRSKLKEQRRRERAYGNTRKYIEDPKKRKSKVRTDQAPAGSTFSFR
jgi:pentatricopeptide repeat protein